MAPEMLVPDAGRRSHLLRLRSSFPESPVMMIIDRSTVSVVLVVEDEMLLCMRAVDIVEDAGFTSVEAVDADQAVKILESRSGIALMFTDVQMLNLISSL